VARELAGSFRVIEPFQRGSGGEPLTVARHLADLHELIEARCGGVPPALVGHSWGAMLALACAAEHPDSVSSLVLVGCGTFDPAARAEFKQTCDERMAKLDLKDRMDRLTQEYTDPDERLAAMGALFERIESFDLAPGGDEGESVDARAHEETWADMLRLQAAGVYPAAFSAIRASAIMLHGAYDPHPGRMIHAGLTHVMPQLEYREWERCGHYPWRERACRDEFNSALREWLADHLE
jgi:pimeloyl-ACP methyl ester carboxylesterase